MNEALLIGLVLAVFIFGYFVMGHVDRFLGKNCQTGKGKYQTKEPSYVMLTEDLSEEEIEKEIRSFREKHAHARVILCDADDTHDLQEGEK